MEEEVQMEEGHRAYRHRFRYVTNYTNVDGDLPVDAPYYLA